MLKGELFNQEMVQAYLEKRKLHTCRPVKPQEMVFIDGHAEPFTAAEISAEESTEIAYIFTCRNFRRCIFPKFQPGDFMYARETWGIPIGLTEKKIIYKADFTDAGAPLADGEHWRPSIHMPREAARLFFRVTEVDVMRMEDVTEEFAREDGFQNDPHCTAKAKFIGFWLDTYGPDAYWMWVYWTAPCTREEALKNE